MRPSRPSSTSSFAYSFGPGPLTPGIKLLIIANVVMFVPTALFHLDVVQRTLGLSPLDVFTRGWLWQPVTYMFLHDGIFHILFNMLALWMFGVELERMWGTKYFLKYYFIVGVGAAATTLVLALVPMFRVSLLPSLTVGASGAVYGILLAYALYFPTRRIYLYLFPVQARYAVMIIGAIAFFSSMEGSSGIAHTTHLGGLAVGYLYLKSGRIHPLSELKYRWVKFRINRMRRKFDVHAGGRADGIDRRVH